MKLVKSLKFSDNYTNILDLNWKKELCFNESPIISLFSVYPYLYEQTPPPNDFTYRRIFKTDQR